MKDWKERYRHKLVTPAEAIGHIASGDRIVLGHVHSTSRLLTEELAAQSGRLTDVRLFNAMNLVPERYLAEEGHYPNITCYSCFLSPTTRKPFLEGRGEYFPLFFHLFPRYFREEYHPTAAIVMLSTPDEQGMCSFGLNADYIVEGCKLARTVIAHINPALPHTGGARISMDELTCAVCQEETLPELPMGRPGEAETAIARFIAPRIPDGACLQLGIGGIPDVVLSMLGDKQDLGIHSELFSDGVIDLYEKGIINGRRKGIDRGKLVATCLIGSRRLFDFADGKEDVCLMPVDYTNDPQVIARNDNVVSINAALQVDLLGQVNADYVKGRPYSGIGGQADFVRGAMMSRGGQSFITLPSTALRGKVSTIVPRFGPESPVTTSRYDVQSVVTEYGVADLWGKTGRQRARALIDIAHPDFRAELEEAAIAAHIL